MLREDPMNALRSLGVGVLVAVLGAGARAEDKPDYAKLVVGKWEVTKADEGTVPVGTVIEFTKDGKLKATIKKGGEEANVEGTYKVEGDAFVQTTNQGGEERTRKITIAKISARQMALKNPEGKAVELKKK
jgi:uncharacterized protein (TIGR03066 family)